MSCSRGLCVGLALAIWVAASSAVVWSEQAEDESMTVVAVYKGGSVSLEELSSWLRAHSKERGEVDLRAQVERIALIEVLAERATTAGLDKEPGTVFRLGETENAVLVAAFRNHVAAQIVVPEERIKARYRELHNRYHRPRTVRLMNIFKRFRPDDTPKVRARFAAEMDEIREAVLEGADFAEMAREHSDSQTRFRGGVIGFVGPGRLPPAVDAVAMKMTPGEISSVVETVDGLTLLRCDAVEPPVETQYEDARPSLEKSLRAKEYDRRWEDFEDTAIRQLELEIDRHALQSKESAADAVVVTSNYGSLSRADALRVLDVAAASAGTQSLNEDWIETVLRNHFVRIATAQHARDLGLDDHPVVTAKLKWRRLLVLETEQLRSMIEARFAPLTEAELRAYWQEHRERFVSRPRYSLSVIRMTIDQDRIREQWIEALALVDRLHSDDSAFENAATELSDHPSASSHGSAGWYSRRQLAATPNVMMAVDGLSPGETSGLVEQDGRLWIIRLDDVEPQRELSFEEARSRVDNVLGNRRTGVIREEIEEKVLLEIELIIPGEDAARSRSETTKEGASVDAPSSVIDD